MKRITPEQERKVEFYYRRNFAGRAIAEKLGLSLSQVYDSLRRQQIERRSSSAQNEINFRRSPLSFSFKSKLNGSERELLVAATMLYYGEGAKTGTTVDFANSDLFAHEIFLKFLRRICRVDENRLRFYLYCFQDQDPIKLIKFWSRELRVSRKLFTKPYVRQRDVKSSRMMANGVLHIRYSDKRLLEKISSLSSEIFQKFR